VSLGNAIVVLVLLSLGILIDRIAFYRLALQRTTEAEIVRKSFCTQMSA
jgi:hypothetical protein